MRLKAISFILVFGILISSVPVVAQSSGTPLAILSALEEILYGEVQSGALVGRVENIEYEIFGKVQSGPIMTRIDRIDEYLSGDLQTTGLKLQLNLAEWGFLAQLNADEPLMDRLDRIETEFFGEPQKDSIVMRLEQLMMYIWGTTDLDMAPVRVPAASLVEIQLLTTVNSGVNQVGDLVQYQVASDVVIDDRIVIPKGTQGTAKVTEVVSAGSLGRNGRVVIDFGKIEAFDGRKVEVRISERAMEQNTRLELAAGASMAGVLLLGPVGLIGGYFVKGENVEITAGAKFFVETRFETDTLGFRLLPVR